MDTLRQDVRLALRALRSAPGYAFLVVVTLAVGIAATTTVVSVMNPYLIREVPYDEADRLVQLGQVDTISGWDAARFSLAQARDLAERSRSLEAVASYFYGSRNLTGDGEAENVLTGVISADLLALLGVEPRLGRSFLPEDGGPGGRNVALLDHGLWMRRYGADPGLLGTTVELDGEPHVVTGIMEPQFRFPFGGVKLWVPLRTDAASEPRDQTRHILVARLRPGWTREAARSELEQIQAELRASHPDTDGRFAGITVTPLGEALNFGYDIMRVSFLVLLGAVGFVLLIACVNVASVTLVRTSLRTREVALRCALGAGRGRIVRQLLTESLVLALAGGALGVALAHGLARLVAPLFPEDLFRVGEIEVDATVLLFSMAVTLLTPLVFGLVPALAASRTSLEAALRSGGRGTGPSRSSAWRRRALVVAEVALAVVLVVGTGLMLRSFFALQDVELGFRGEHVLTAELSLTQSGDAGEEEQRIFFERAVQELEATPGIRRAGAVVPLPMNHAIWSMQFAVPERAPADRAEWPLAHEFRVSGEYFEAMGVPLLSGRTFDARDAADAPRVVVVSRALAERYFPDRDPVGESLSLRIGEEAVPATVIGVVASVRHEGFEDELAVQIYRPFSQASARRRFLVLSVDGEPLAAQARVEEALARIDPGVPAVYRPMRDIVAENALQWSFSSLFLGAFGAVALALASLGVYGVVSYSVVTRRREIATRMALGATSGDIRRTFVGDGLVLGGLGIAVGLAGAAVASRWIASLLYDVSPEDPLTFAAAAALFLVTALAASALPARRAARTAPWSVLRSE